MEPTVSTLMEVAAEVARKAGEVALSHYRRGVSVETKSDGSPVTLADRAAEQAAREIIARRFPTDGILGEEHGETNPGARRRWILDPIDGTKSFVRGVPLWGTLVAVAEGEDVLVGVANFPPVGELLVAGKGQGCLWNGSRCHVSAVSELSKATVLVTDPRFEQFPDWGTRWRQLEQRAAVARGWGDCYGYLLIATGRAEVMADELLAPWDSAALHPIITEAGGVFTDFTGTPGAFGKSGLATNAALAQSVRTVLKP
ncbi:MAG: histidinol-phosphatase [Myxococcaceae bacterium]